MEIITKQLNDASSGLVKPSIDANGAGIHVRSSARSLKRGELILSCPASAIALDAPYRLNRCAYCAMKLTSTNENNPIPDHDAVVHCQKCCIISICQSCKMKGVHDWHRCSGECAALQCLVRAHYAVFGSSSGEKVQTNRDNGEINTGMANEVDSSYILTIRIIMRRLSDCKLKIVSPLPAVEWALLDELYKAEMGEAGSDERRYYDAAITKLCQHMGKTMVHSNEHRHMNKDQNEVSKNDGLVHSDRSNDHNWQTKAIFDSVMGKVVGCGHAVTDVTTSLGCQCIGRALFLEQSFYNHACVPNAFLSCHIQTDATSKADHQNMGNDNRGDERCHQCALISRVHCISNIDKSDPVTISYIPTSGLDPKERHQRLYQNYSFSCQCEACDEKTDLGKKLNKCLSLPDDCDVDILRQMQFSCHEKMNEIQMALIRLNEEADDNLEGKKEIENELQFCISTIKMNQRGIKFQKIPPSHEVSIESHRLLATSLSLMGEYDLAVKEHTLFLDSVQAVQEIFDPVATATSLLEFAKDLQRKEGEKKTHTKYYLILSKAYNNAKMALGIDHSFVRQNFESFITDGEDRIELGRGCEDKQSTLPTSKRLKMT